MLGFSWRRTIINVKIHSLCLNAYHSLIKISIQHEILNVLTFYRNTPFQCVFLARNMKMSLERRNLLSFYARSSSRVEKYWPPTPDYQKAVVGYDKSCSDLVGIEEFCFQISVFQDLTGGACVPEIIVRMTYISASALTLVQSSSGPHMLARQWK